MAYEEKYVILQQLPKKKENAMQGTKDKNAGHGSTSTHFNFFLSNQRI